MEHIETVSAFVLVNREGDYYGFRLVEGGPPSPFWSSELITKGGLYLHPAYLFNDLKSAGRAARSMYMLEGIRSEPRRVTVVIAVKEEEDG